MILFVYLSISLLICFLLLHKTFIAENAHGMHQRPIDIFHIVIAAISAGLFWPAISISVLVDYFVEKKNER